MIFSHEQFHIAVEIAAVIVVEPTKQQRCLTVRCHLDTTNRMAPKQARKACARPYLNHRDTDG